MRCKDKVAIVTGGAGKGMGRSMSLTLAREGAKVVVNYLSSKVRANEIVEYIHEQGREAIAVQANVFFADGCEQLVNKAVSEFGHVDICIVSPGADLHLEQIDVFDPETALRDLHEEIAPLFHLMRLTLPGMYEREWGRLIAIALHPQQISPAFSYNVGKAARIQAILLSYKQAWERGVTVNVLAPGPVSPLSSIEEAIEQVQHGASWKERDDVSPQDIAEGIAFLCSEEGKYITGCVLPYLYRL